MKYCQNCGIELDDNANFCIECGGLAVSAEPSAPDYSDVQLLSQKNVFSVVKECASSTLFLIAIICYTASVASNIVSLVYSAIGSTNLIVADDVYALSPAATVISGFIGSLVGMAPAVLMVIGMWITYASARKDGERISTSGLSIIKVIVIIMLVCVCIALGMGAFILTIIVVIAFVAPEAFDLSSSMDGYGMVAGSEVFSRTFFITFVVIMFIFIIAIGVLAIIYMAKAAKTVESIRETAKTGKISGKVSSFVAVMAIIIGGIFGMSTFTYLAQGDLLTSFAMLLSAASPMLFGILLFVYKNKLRAISEQE